MYRLILRSNKPEAEKFQDWIVEEVLPSIRKTGTYDLSKNVLLQRFRENRARVPYGYFSIITESYNIFFQHFEFRNFDLPLDFCPDISIGKIFCKWLRDTKNYDTDSLPKYQHHYPDGRIVDANMYPMELWNPFLDFFFNIWVKDSIFSYLKRKNTDESKQILEFIESNMDMINFTPSKELT